MVFQLKEPTTPTLPPLLIQLQTPTPLTLRQLKTPTTYTPQLLLLLYNAPALPTLALVVAAAVAAVLQLKAPTTPTLPPLLTLPLVLLQLKSPTTHTPLPLLLFPNLPTIALVVTAAVVFQLKALTTPTLRPPTVPLLLIQLKAPTTHTPLPLLLPFNAPTLHTLALVIAAAAVISQHLFLPLQVLDLILLTHAMLYLLCSYAAYMP